MINHITVIGGGSMGRGIAYTAALAGFKVTLQDISNEAIELMKYVKAGRLGRKSGRGFFDYTNKK